MTPTQEGADCSSLNPKPFLSLMTQDATTDISLFLFNNLFYHPRWQSNLLATLYTIHTWNTHLFYTCLTMGEQGDTLLIFLVHSMFLCQWHKPPLPSTMKSYNTQTQKSHHHIDHIDFLSLAHIDCTQQIFNLIFPNHFIYGWHEISIVQHLATNWLAPF